MKSLLLKTALAMTLSLPALSSMAVIFYPMPGFSGAQVGGNPSPSLLNVTIAGQQCKPGFFKFSSTKVYVSDTNNVSQIAWQLQSPWVAGRCLPGYPNTITAANNVSAFGNLVIVNYTITGNGSPLQYIVTVPGVSSCSLPGNDARFIACS